MTQKKREKHIFYMQLAIKQAEKAYKKHEIPIGAVIIDKKGTILGCGYNKMEQKKCQTRHAEVIAIEKACKKINDWRLDGCWLYVTLEPCSMCFGLIQLSRLQGIVFGAKSPLFGFGYRKNKKLPLLKKDLVIQEGIEKDKCIQLLQNFFKTIRE